MKVGMILDETFPPDPRVENEALTLKDQGYDIHILCYGYDIAKDEEFEYKGIRVYRKACPKWVYKFSALAYTVPVYHWITKGWIEKFVEDYRIDVIHVHDIQIYRGAKWANKKHKPLVLDLHENRPEIMKFYKHVQSLLGRVLIYPSVWKKHEYRAIKSADQIVVVTEEAKAYYVDEVGVNPAKIISLPNTVRKGFYEQQTINVADVERFKDDFVVLYVGETGLRRGLLTAIAALNLLKSKIPNIKLVIVGKSSTDHVLKQYVKQLKLEDYVSFEGWQNFETFPAYIEASSVCISPLHRNIHHDTTYANKIFQYMSMGKPVVVSDCPAQANVVNDANAGLVIRAEEPEELVGAIMRLYNNPDESERFGRNGKQFVRENFSWEKNSLALTELYKKISNEL